MTTLLVLWPPADRATDERRDATLRRAMIAAQLGDLATTLVGVLWLGIDLEINPLMRAAWDVAGPFGLSGVKLAGLGIVLWLAAHYPLSRRGILWLGIVAGLLLIALNGSMLAWAVLG